MTKGPDQLAVWRVLPFDATCELTTTEMSSPFCVLTGENPDGFLLCRLSLCLTKNTLTAKDRRDIECFQEISAVSSHALIKWSLGAPHMPLPIIIMHHCALQCVS